MSKIMPPKFYVTTCLNCNRNILMADKYDFNLNKYIPYNIQVCKKCNTNGQPLASDNLKVMLEH